MGPEPDDLYLNVIRDVAAGLEGNRLTGRARVPLGRHHCVAHGAQQQPGEKPDVRHAVQKLLGTLVTWGHGVRSQHYNGNGS